MPTWQRSRSRNGPRWKRYAARSWPSSRTPRKASPTACPPSGSTGTWSQASRRSRTISPTCHTAAKCSRCSATASPDTSARKARCTSRSTSRCQMTWSNVSSTRSSRSSAAEVRPPAPTCAAKTRRPEAEGAPTSREVGEQVRTDVRQDGIRLLEWHVDDVVVLRARGRGGDECRDADASLEERLLDLPADDAVAVEQDALPVERAVARHEVARSDGVAQGAVAVLAQGDRADEEQRH